MNPRFAAFVVAALVAIAFFMLSMRMDRIPGEVHPWAHHYISKRVVQNMPASLGGGENLSGRDYYEWMRLRDPSSGRIPPNIRDRELQYAKTLPLKVPSLRKSSDGSNAAAAWDPRGPHNVGGRTRALGLDVRNPAIMLAGGASGGMWRSASGGGSWSRVGPGNDVYSTTCVVQDRRSGKEDTWYYGTGELRGNSASGGGGSLYRGDGIFKSTDNGLSWAKLAATSTANVLFDQPFDYVWNIALSRSDLVRDVVVAATLGTLQRSIDGGQTWIAALGTIANDAGPRFTDVVSSSSGVFYATLSSTNMILTNTNAVNQGIWRSTDGLVWSDITPITWPAQYNRVVAAISPSNEDIVYFLAETPGTGPTGHMLWRYTYVSGDGSGAGGIWSDRSAFLPNESGVEGNAAFGSQSSYDLVVAVSPTNSDIVFAGGINLYRSLDGGQLSGGWIRIGGYASPTVYNRYPNNHPDHHALVFHPTNSAILYNGNDGGVYRTSNALSPVVSWTPLNNGYITTQFYTIAVDGGSMGDEALVGGMQDNGTWYTPDFGESLNWTEVAGGDGGFTQVEPGGASLFVSFQNGVTYRLTNVSSGRIDPSGGSDYLFISPYLLDPSEPKRMYFAAGASVWRNSDVTAIPLGSSSPTTVNWTMLQNSTVSSSTISALAASKEPSGVLYYGSSSGRVYKMNDAHQAQPAAINLSVNAGFPSGGYVSSITVDPLNADRVLVAFSNYSVPSLFSSTNGGSSWTDVSGNLEEQPNGAGNGPSVRWVAMLPDSAAYYYFVGTSTGLYSSRSLQGGSTVWVHEGTNSIGYPVVDMIGVRESDGYVAVGTHGRGVFTSTVPIVPPPPENRPVPSSFAVSENFPNPFNAGTNVTLTIEKSGHVRVDVFDMSGSLVSTLADQNFLPTSSGVRIYWNGTNSIGLPAATGVYLIAARTDSQVRATKAVLIR